MRNYTPTAERRGYMIRWPRPADHAVTGLDRKRTDAPLYKRIDLAVESHCAMQRAPNGNFLWTRPSSGSDLWLSRGGNPGLYYSEGDGSTLQLPDCHHVACMLLRQFLFTASTPHVKSCNLTMQPVVEPWFMDTFKDWRRRGRYTCTKLCCSNGYELDVSRYMPHSYYVHVSASRQPSTVLRRQTEISW